MDNWVFRGLIVITWMKNPTTDLISASRDREGHRQRVHTEKPFPPRNRRVSDASYEKVEQGSLPDLKPNIHIIFPVHQHLVSTQL